MSDTPRTDKEKQIPEKFDELDYVVPAHFARELERELDSEVEKAIRQNDQLIAQRDQLKAERIGWLTSLDTADTYVQQLKAEVEKLKGWLETETMNREEHEKLVTDRDRWREMARDMKVFVERFQEPRYDAFETVERSHAGTKI